MKNQDKIEMENKISNKCAKCGAENMVDVVISADIKTVNNPITLKNSYYVVGIVKHMCLNCGDIHISHECKRITFDDMKRILNEAD